MNSAPVMEVSEQIIGKDQKIVLEEISTKGIIFLQTSCNESEIAIPYCQGRSFAHDSGANTATDAVSDGHSNRIVD